MLDPFGPGLRSEEKEGEVVFDVVDACAARVTVMAAVLFSSVFIDRVEEAMGLNGRRVVADRECEGFNAVADGIVDVMDVDVF